MATNFEVVVGRSGDIPVLRVEGDFDATSAWELIYAIKKLPAGSSKINIQTDGLKTIYPFGLDVFQKFMRTLNGYCPKLDFIGRNATVFPLKDACVAI
jgi:hypothetical protein